MTAERQQGGVREKIANLLPHGLGISYDRDDAATRAGTKPQVISVLIPIETLHMSCSLKNELHTRC